MGKWLDEARRMKPFILKGAQKLEDTDALEIPKVYEEWDSAKTYNQNEKIRYQGVLYRCLLDHIAQETWDPLNASSIWTRVLIPGEDIIYPWKQPDSTNPYKKDDKVTHNNKKWISIIDGNVWEPGIYGWEEIDS